VLVEWHFLASFCRKSVWPSWWRFERLAANYWVRIMA